MAIKMSDWKDRFLTRGTITAGELAHRFNIRNPRKHPDRQAGAVEGSLNLLGWIAAVKLSSCGGETDLKRNKKAVMFDGHLRVKLVLSKFGPDALVPVEWYDLNEGETNQALLVLDQMTGMAELDFTVLDDLIKNTPPLEIPDFSEWMNEVLEGATSGMITPDFQPTGADTQPRLDRKARITCPHCGMEFEPE